MTRLPAILTLLLLLAVAGCEEQEITRAVSVRTCGVNATGGFNDTCQSWYIRNGWSYNRKAGRVFVYLKDGSVSAEFPESSVQGIQIYIYGEKP